MDIGGIDVVQVDVTRVGGLARSKRIGWDSAERHRLCVNHSYKTGVNLAASAALGGPVLGMRSLRAVGTPNVSGANESGGANADHRCQATSGDNLLWFPQLDAHQASSSHVANAPETRKSAVRLAPDHTLRARLAQATRWGKVSSAWRREKG